MSVKIITDSACDLPKDLIAQYEIDVVPLLVYLGNEQYEDGVTIDPLELYRRMREGNIYKTAQATPGQFATVFRKYARENRECIYIAFSSNLSGTYESSIMAINEIKNEYPDFRLEIIDTKCASLGFGMVVLEAAKMAKAGRSQREICEAVRFQASHMEHIFTVDQLEYLWRGGRVSRSKALIGDLLNVKPILNVEDGKLVPIDKARGRKKLFARMAEIIGERGVDLDKQTIGISHGDDLEAVELAKQALHERFGCKNFLVSLVGAAIGAHSGPGTLAIFFLNVKQQ